MGLVYEDECCGCAVPSYPCMGSACPNRNVKHYYCDGDCGEEFSPSELYDFDGDMLCVDCLVKQFRKVSERSD